MNIQNCLFFVFSILFLSSCGPDKEKEISENEDLLSQRAYFSIQAITKPIAIGEDVIFSFEMLDSNKIMDSLVYLINNEKVGQVTKPGLKKTEFTWSSKGKNTGKYNFRIEGTRKYELRLKNKARMMLIVEKYKFSSNTKIKFKHFNNLNAHQFYFICDLFDLK